MPQEWRPTGIRLCTSSFQASAPLTCQPPSPESMHTLTIQRRLASNGRSAQQRHGNRRCHLLHSTLTRSSGGNARHLNSRHAFVSVAQPLMSFYDDDNNRSAGGSLMECRVTGKHYALSSPTSAPTQPPGIALPRTAWVWPNVLRTGVGRFRSC